MTSALSLSLALASALALALASALALSLASKSKPPDGGESESEKNNNKFFTHKREHFNLYRPITMLQLLQPRVPFLLPRWQDLRRAHLLPLCVG